MPDERDSRELHRLFYTIGACLWHLQRVEDGLVEFLSMKIAYEREREGLSVSEEEALELILDRRKNLTFGPLIDACFARRAIPPALLERYKWLRDERHWMVHVSLLDRSLAGSPAVARENRAALSFRLRAIRKEAIALKLLLENDVERWEDTAGESDAVRAVRGARIALWS